MSISVLVATVDYPNINNKAILMYVHTRNLFYVTQGLEVTVLNFSTDSDYIYEGIKVISLDTYIKSDNQYNILICHAANIRNHYRFLKKYGNSFSHFIFFYHGHEILKINATYSKPYPFNKKSTVSIFFQNTYDTCKLYIWRKFLLANIAKTKFFFVSDWMLTEFVKWTKIPYTKYRKIKLYNLL